MKKTTRGIRLSRSQITHKYYKNLWHLRCDIEDSEDRAKQRESEIRAWVSILEGKFIPLEEAWEVTNNELARITRVLGAETESAHNKIDACMGKIKELEVALNVKGDICKTYQIENNRLCSRFADRIKALEQKQTTPPSMLDRMVRWMKGSFMEWNKKREL